MFYERLKKLCDERGLALTNVVVNELHMSRGNLSRWKNGNVPKGDTLSALAEYFGVSTDYLLGTAELKKDCLATLDNQVLSLTAEEVRLVLKYRALDDEGRTMVESTLIQETRRVETAKGETANVG